MPSSVQQLDLPAQLESYAHPTASGMSRFVVGEENALLVPVIASLVGSPEAAIRFNPLTVTGPSGSGKSHLVQGVLRRLNSGQLKSDSNRVATNLHLSAADFGRQFLAAHNENRLSDWRASLRGADLLVIEDLQNLLPRQTLYQELTNTLDAIVAREGQVVLTANQHPMNLANLLRDGNGSGLIDRLEAGLILRLQAPGLDARRSLLHLAANQRGLELPPAELDRLAQQTAGLTPQRLLGRLARLDHRQQTGFDLPPVVVASLTFKQILAVVARYYQVTQAALVSSSRRKSLVQARGLATYLARRLTTTSYAEIGRQLGRRDHSTMINAEQRFQELIAADDGLQQAAEEVERILQAT